MEDLEPKPWYEGLLDLLDRWRLAIGLILLLVVVQGGFALLLLEKFKEPGQVVTGTSEVQGEMQQPETLKAAGKPTVKAARKSRSSKSQSASSVAQAPKPVGKININTASATQLDTLKGVGPVIAQRIIDYRTTNGPFKSLEEIKEVKGIGDKTFEKLKDDITI